MKVVVEVDFRRVSVVVIAVFLIFLVLVKRTRRMQRHVYFGDWGIGRGILSQRSDTAAKRKNWQGPEDVVFAKCEDYCGSSSSSGGGGGERCVFADGEECNRVCCCEDCSIEITGEKLLIDYDEIAEVRRLRGFLRRRGRRRRSSVCNQ